MNQVKSHPNENTAQLLWTAFILMFFMIQAVIWTIAITVTATDTSHTVVADYDELALKWDEVKKMQQASAELGWTCEINVGETADVLGNRNLTLKLKDRNGQPLENISLELTAFHRAHAAKPFHLSFTQVDSVTFSTILPVKKYGKWQFSGKAFNDDQLYLIEQTLPIKKSAGR